MITQELLDYISAQLKQGVPPEQIKMTLLASGWQQPDIDTALDSFQQPQSQPAQVPQAANVDLDTAESQIIDTTKPSSVKKIFTFLLILLVFIAITGGGVYAYFYFFPTPKQVLGKMFDQIGKVTTLSYEGKVNMKLSSKTQDPLSNPASDVDPSQMNIPSFPLPNDLTSSVLFSGDNDVVDLDNPKSRLSITLKTDALGEGEMGLGFEQLSISTKEMYVRLIETTNIPFFDLESIKNEWIKVDLEEYKKDIAPDESMGKKASDKKLSEKKLEQLSELSKKHEFIVISDSLPSEKIMNVDVYHYKYKIDKEILKEFIAKSAPIIYEKEYSEEEIKTISDSLAKTFNNFGDIGGDIWIGKNDYYPYKFTLAFTYSDVKDTLTFDGEMSFKNFNKPVQIAAPISSITIEEATERVFASIYADDNGNGIPDAYELPGTDYSNLGNPADGIDGSEYQYPVVTIPAQ